jgi:L-fuculose-phosphate aldolase
MRSGNSSAGRPEVRYFSQRRALLEAARELSDSGLNPGTSGNVSVRTESGLLITPTGLPYQAMDAQDLVEMRLDGRAGGHQRAPSSEWRIHCDLYQARSDVSAIVHAHPMFCTTLSTLRKEIPAVHYMIAVTGASVVRCAGYATYGTEALSKNVLEAIAGSKACLMANHGMVAVGAGLPEALRVAREVEVLAEQYWRGLQVGIPHVLDDREVARVIEKFHTYGKQPVRRWGTG